LPLGDSLQPVRDHAGQPAWPGGQFFGPQPFVDDPRPAESHADVGRGGETVLHAVVEAGQHVVVLVQEVHQPAAGEADRPVPVARQPQPLLALNKIDPSLGVDRRDEPAGESRP